eukprot:8695402-Lingulodinium_polyedra.AAC.1
MQCWRPSAATAARRTRARSMRTPFFVCARSVRRVRLASRCGGGRQMQPHRCVAFAKRDTMMWLRWLSAAATAR